MPTPRRDQSPLTPKSSGKWDLPPITAVDQIESWDFDILEIEDKDLETIVYHIFTKLDACTRFSITRKKLRAFVRAVKSKYQDCTYHNFRHAVDVTHNVFLYLHTYGASKHLSEFDTFVLIVSALCHDLDHPGTNNAYMIASQSPIARKYKNRSVLENYHASVALEILGTPEFNIFDSLAPAEMDKAFKMMNTYIVATDMSHHQKVVQDLNMRTSLKRSFSKGTKADVELLGKVLLKAADIGNCAKPIHIAKYWSKCLAAEFEQQIQLEQEADLSSCLPFSLSSPLDEAQHGVDFLTKVTKPFYKLISKILPSTKHSILAHLETNLKEWSKMVHLHQDGSDDDDDDDDDEMSMLDETSIMDQTLDITRDEVELSEVAEAETEEVPAPASIEESSEEEESEEEEEAEAFSTPTPTADSGNGRLNGEVQLEIAAETSNGSGPSPQSVPLAPTPAKAPAEADEGSLAEESANSDPLLQRRTSALVDLKANLAQLTSPLSKKMGRLPSMRSSSFSTNAPALGVEGSAASDTMYSGKDPEMRNFLETLRDSDLQRVRAQTAPATSPSGDARPARPPARRRASISGALAQLKDLSQGKIGKDDEEKEGEKKKKFPGLVDRDSLDDSDDVPASALGNIERHLATPGWKSMDKMDEDESLEFMTSVAQRNSYFECEEGHSTLQTLSLSMKSSMPGPPSPVAPAPEPEPETVAPPEAETVARAATLHCMAATLHCMAATLHWDGAWVFTAAAWVGSTLVVLVLRAVVGAVLLMLDSVYTTIFVTITSVSSGCTAILACIDMLDAWTAAAVWRATHWLDCCCHRAADHLLRPRSIGAWLIPMTAYVVEDMGELVLCSIAAAIRSIEYELRTPAGSSGSPPSSLALQPSLDDLRPEEERLEEHRRSGYEAEDEDDDTSEAPSSPIKGRSDTSFLETEDEDDDTSEAPSEDTSAPPEAETVAPPDVSRHLQRSRELLTSGNVMEALLAANTGCALSPGCVEAHEMAARVHWELCDWSGAEERLVEFLTANTNVAPADAQRLQETIDRYRAYQTHFAATPLFNCCAVLGLSGGFNARDLRDAYKRAMRTYHPDKLAASARRQGVVLQDLSHEQRRAFEVSSNSQTLMLDFAKTTLEAKPHFQPRTAQSCQEEFEAHLDLLDRLAREYANDPERQRRDAVFQDLSETWCREYQGGAGFDQGQSPFDAAGVHGFHGAWASGANFCGGEAAGEEEADEIPFPFPTMGPESQFD